MVYVLCRLRHITTASGHGSDGVGHHIVWRRTQLCIVARWCCVHLGYRMGVCRYIAECCKVAMLHSSDPCCTSGDSFCSKGRFVVHSHSAMPLFTLSDARIVRVQMLDFKNSYGNHLARILMRRLRTVVMCVTDFA